MNIPAIILITLVLVSLFWLYLFRETWMSEAKEEETKFIAALREDRDHLRLQLATLLNHIHAPRPAPVVTPVLPPTPQNAAPADPAPAAPTVPGAAGAVGIEG